MSGFLAGKVWQSNLPPHLKPLAAALADVANDNGTSIFPTFGYTAWLLSCSKRRVSRGIASLVDMGILELVETTRYRRSAEYRLRVEMLPLRAPWSKPVGGCSRAIQKG